MTRNRMSEARIAHRQYRQGTMSDKEIEEEFQALRKGLLAEAEQGRTKELFQGVNLKRTAIVVGANFFQQASGQAFASQYGARFIKSLETVEPFTITTSNLGIVIVVLLSTLLLSDRLGRRYVALWLLSLLCLLRTDVGPTK
jgi:MFS transporter, SP family, sugar:H+ symporter